MSSLLFDLTNYTTLGDSKQVVVYESYIFLTIKPDSEGDDAWKSQITELYPLNSSFSDVITTEGKLTTDENLLDKTGEFKELKNEPSVDRDVSTDFTDTIREWISPYDSSDNKDNNGVALVNKYTDGSSEDTDAKDVRYYSFTDESTLIEYIPYIDICYKIIEVPVCEEGEDYYEKTVDVSAASLLVEDESQGYTNETFTFGQDVDGKVYRTVIKFDVSSVLGDDETTYDVNDAWIKLNYLNPSDSDTGSVINRTVTVYKVTVDWDEDTVTWDDIKDNYDSSTPIGTATVTEDQVGGTAVWINIADTIIDWADNGVTDNYGFVLIDDDEDTASRIPQFAHEDDTSEDHHKPTMAICKKEITTTTSTTTPSTTSTTTTPSTTSSTTTPSTTSSTTPLPPPECTKPDGGYRDVVPLISAIKSGVFTEGYSGYENLDELIIGRTSAKPLRMSALLFDLGNYTTLPSSEQIVVYESYIFLTVKPDSQTDSDDWKSQITELYPLDRSFGSVVTSSGQLTSEQNLGDKTGEFDEMTKEPTVEKDIAADFTDTIREWLSPYDVSDNQPNYGVALVNSYSDGSSTQTSAKDIRYYSFTNDSTLVEYIPYIDICYKIIDVPVCNETAEYYEKTVEVSAATLLVHGDSKGYNNESLTFGQDVDGNVYRTVIKFDVSSVINDNFKVIDVNDAWIKLNYLSPSESDTGSVATRNVTVYKITTSWDEDTVSWDDIKNNYDPTPIGTATVSEDQVGGTAVWINIADTVIDWAENGVTDNYGFVLIDNAEGTSSRIPLFADNEDESPSHHKPTLAICKKEGVITTTTPTIATTTSSEKEITKEVTVTTGAPGSGPNCEARKVSPVDKITIVDNGTICVSEEPIQLRYCYEREPCDRFQSRTPTGALVTTCKCCLPIFRTSVESFDCFGVKKDIEVNLISTCSCNECDEGNLYEYVTKRSEKRRRDAPAPEEYSYEAGFAPASHL